MRALQLTFTSTAVALVASLAGGPSPALAVPSCSSGSTLAISKSARVFQVKLGSIRRVYGCSTSTQKRSYLGRAGSVDLDTSALALSGPRIAYVRTFCNEAGCRKNVLVRDLKTRKRLLWVATASGDDQKVTDLVLSKSGTVAWIVELNPDAPTARYVSSASKGQPLGQPVLVLANGLDIIPGSLALAGTTLYWTQATAKSMLLPS